jgi:hypothetical protein
MFLQGKQPSGDLTTVFHVDGALPMRLGVLRQDRDTLHLFPSGEVRVETVGVP